MKLGRIFLAGFVCLAGSGGPARAQAGQMNWYIVSTTYVLPSMAISDIEYYKIGEGEQSYAECIQEIDEPVLGIPPGTPRQLQDGAIIQERPECKLFNAAQEALLPHSGMVVYFTP